VIIIKTLFKAVFTISAFSVLSRFISFIFKIYLSNQISTTQLGVYSVAFSVAGIFLTILSSGLPLIVSRFTAKSYMEKRNKKNHEIVSAGLVISIILSFIVTIIILLGKPLFSLIFTDNTSYMVLLTLIPSLVFSAIYAPIKGFLWGCEDFFAVSMVEVFEQIIKIIICVILFAIMPASDIPAGLSLSIACVFSTLLGFVFYYKKGGKIVHPRNKIKPLFKSSAPITAIRVAGSLLPPLISIILPIMLVKAGYSNSQALSELGILMGMTFPILTIPTTLVGSLAMALIPKLTILQEENNNKTLKNQIIHAITFTLFCCFIFFPIFYSLGIPMCEFLFNNTASGMYLQNFAWIVVPMGLSQISTSILNSLGKEKFVFYSYFISASIMFISILILPQFIGISALLIGLALQNSLVSIINIIKIKKVLNSSTSSLKLITIFSIISFIIGLTSKWLFSIFNLYLSNFVAMIIVSIFASIGFIILCCCFNLFNLQLLLHLKQNKSVKKV